jgi:hypothetical protein
MWLHAVQYNLEKDKGYSKILKIEQPREFDWFLHEALLGRLPTLSAYQHVEFPAKVPEGYDKPIGIEYGRYREWDRVQTEIDSLSQLEELEARSQLSADPPQNEMAAPPQNDWEEEPPAAVPSPLSDPAPQNNHIIQQSGKPAEINHPQSVCARKLGGMDRVSLLNTYLVELKQFSQYQYTTFWELVSLVWTLVGGEEKSEDMIVESVCQTWNTRHILLHKQGGIGLGGLIRAGHVKLLMKQCGYNVRQVQISLGNPSTMIRAQGDMKPTRVLGKRGVDALSLEAWL